MGKVMIVGMKPEHVLQMAALHGSTFKAVGETTKEFLAFLKAKRIGFCALDGSDKVIGYIVGVVSMSGIYLNWMAVKPGARNKGVGRNLMKALENEGLKAGAAMARLDTRNRFKNAIKLYLDNGYEIYGCQLASDGELLICMSKKLLKE